LDGLAFSNGTKNRVLIMEVKSHLREEVIKQIERHAERFPEVWPEHKNKMLNFLVAFVDGDAVKTLRQCVSRYIENALLCQAGYGDTSREIDYLMSNRR
jgi:adenosyl cobinamide kinase/adenosyl cobinamide phosphate guanylyltransferase